MKRRSFLQLSAVGAIVAACGGAQAPAARTGGPATSTPSPTPTPQATKATIELVKGGSFTITLRPDKAPQTVGRFAGKARSGFYDNLTFHRVEDWVVQGGDPLGTGTGGGQVPSEYNDLPFKTGAAGIARRDDPSQMNDSQFFIVKRDSDFLNTKYANFGQVTAGMDVVTGIKIGDRIKSIRIE